MSRTSPKRFSLNDFARKDFFFCLGIWLAIEIVCFVLLPALQLVQTGSFTNLWLIVSLILGIGGAALTAWATQLSTSLAAQGKTPKRATQTLLFLLNWLGLLGIAFPLLFMSTQLFSKLFALLRP